MSAAAAPPTAGEPVAMGDFAYLMSRLNGLISESEFVGVFDAMAERADVILDAILDPAAHGFQAPPLFERYHRERARVYSDRPAVDMQIRRVLALARDITPDLHAHMEERARYEGNTTLEVIGPTGMAKSSCLLGLASRHCGLEAAVQRAHAEGGPEAATRELRGWLAIDVADLPAKLPKRKEGECIIMDEQLHLVGEGSETATRLLASAEDTLRGTGISLFFASPGRREGHQTSQGLLEAVSWSPAQLRDGSRGRMEGMFLYSLNLGDSLPLPLGTVRLPWCSKVVYDAYRPIKKENLERTLAFQFHAAGAVDEAAVAALFENARLTTLLRHKSRPTKADWRRYVVKYLRSMSTTEAESIAAEMEERWAILRDAPQDYETIWGAKPTPAMLATVKGIGPRTLDGAR